MHHMMRHSSETIVNYYSSEKFGCMQSEEIDTFLPLLNNLFVLARGEDVNGSKRTTQKHCWRCIRKIDLKGFDMGSELRRI